MSRSCLLPAVALCASLFGCATPANLQPEGSSGYQEKPGWTTHRFAVAAANPLASDAGYQVLRAGGSAVDAAIAVQMVLALVEPQSSGIGGGAFMLHFDGKHTQAFDGRETAPSAATPSLFIGKDGKPLDFMDAVVGGRSVGVPGTLRMLALAHQQHGKLPWTDLFQPAISLARDGFKVSQRMATLLTQEKNLSKDPVAASYFYDESGNPWSAGHVLKNPELAEVLSRIAKEGPDALVHGDIAEAIVKKVRSHPNNPGAMTLQDLQNYKAVEREPLCFEYRLESKAKTYDICGMPPPSSGTIAIGQILGILTSTSARQMPLEPNSGQPSADWLHLYSEASRLAFADRAQFVADPAFVPPPTGSWKSLLEPNYLKQRARQISDSHAAKPMKEALPGNPGGIPLAFASMPNQPEYGTTHISIIDAYGNAIAMTSTIEDAWGSRMMVNRGKGLKGGFLLNNELTDFSFVPVGANGKPVANRVEGGKRPRSSMSPTLVFDKSNGQLVMSLGSPGGAMIIHFTAKTLYGVLDWNLNAQQAISLPNFGTISDPLMLEEGRFDKGTVAALRESGHEVLELNLTSGLQAIQKISGGFFGGADPRREGIVMGD